MSSFRFVDSADPSAIIHRGLTILFIGLVCFCCDYKIRDEFHWWIPKLEFSIPFL